MKCLLIIAHPLSNSLCRYIAENTIKHLKGKGYQVTVKDLYKEGFDPVMSIEERHSYPSQCFDNTRLKEDIEQLQQAESIVLIFPTWWFGFPAILKGWFDRVWAPGYAFEHASDTQPMKAGLTNLKEMKVITTLGAPWWVDRFIIKQPVKKILKLAVLGGCAKHCKFTMLSLYDCQNIKQNRLDKFIDKIKTHF